MTGLQFRLFGRFPEIAKRESFEVDGPARLEELFGPVQIIPQPDSLHEIDAFEPLGKVVFLSLQGAR